MTDMLSRNNYRSFAVLCCMLSIFLIHLVVGQLGCDKAPCSSSATCQNVVTEPYYRCSCAEGFTGFDCRDDINECLFDNPCRNGGLCINNLGGYVCHCDPAWGGDQCDVLIKKCAADPCRNGATCTDVGDSYYCRCVQGYTGKDCEFDINECLISPCADNSQCINTPGSFSCVCQSGYTGALCGVEINECSPNPCQNNATCSDLVNGYVCRCGPGYSGLHCDTETQECEGQPCLNGRCDYYSNGTLYCRCKSGYAGSYCDLDIQECDSNPCSNRGQCVDDLNSYTCYCQPGFTGNNCEVDINECDPNHCVAGSTCVDLDNSFRCDCADGFSGETCSVNINECASSPCDNNATCLDGISGYTCVCNEGFTGDVCETDINDCTEGSCLYGLCIDEVNKFTCQCYSGYTGIQCETNMNDCGPVSCLNGGSCVDGVNSYSCLCPTAFTGNRCEDNIDDCINSACINGTCIDMIDNYTCSCLPGFEGRYCDREINECLGSQACLNNASCIDQLNGYICSCQPGYTGPQCEVNIDECSDSPCVNSERCIDEINNYTCLCSPGYEGRNCEIEINECEIFTPCYNSATCEDLVNGYICHCLSGYNGSRCEINLDDCHSSPCFGYSQCIDGNNNYTCVCPPGYTGPRCDVDVNECSTTPCVYGGVCTEDAINSYRCNCVREVYGDNCNFIKSASIQNKEQRILMPNVNWSDPIIMKFSYRSIYTEGILLSAQGRSENGSSQLILVQLYSGRIYLTVDTGIDSTTVSQRLATQSVQIIIQQDGISLSQPPSVFSEDHTLVGSIHLSSLNLTILGAPTVISSRLRASSHDITKHFTGCIGNISINSEKVNIADTQLTATPGCTQMSHCPLNYCSSHGTCIETWETTPLCICDADYTGRHCEILIKSEFESDQMLYLPTTPDVISSISFIITLNNNSQSAVLLYTTESNKISITYQEGEYTAILLGVGFSLSCTVNTSLTTVEIQFNLFTYSFTLRVRPVYQSNPAVECSRASSSRLLVRSPLYLGKLHTSNLMDVWRNYLPFTNGFSGCFGELRVNGSVLSLSDDQPTGLGNDPPVAQPGCSGDNTCSEQCINGGICEGLWDRIECHCVNGYTGERCELGSPVTFDGSTSVISVDVNRLVSKGPEIGQLEFRTRAKDVTILHSVYLSLDFTININSFGEIEILLLQSEQTRTITIQGFDIADASWHTLSWSISHFITLKLDSTNQIHAWDFYIWPQGDRMQVLIGAKQLEMSENTLVQRFEGCMRNVRFYNSDVQLIQSVGEGRSVTLHNVMTGCHSQNVCERPVCAENSVCVNEWNQYSCSCLSGWQGADCSKSVDDCESVDCGFGSCLDLHQNYTCRCQTGYIGSHCDKAVSLCSLNPCHSDHTVQCIDTGLLQYTCVCLPGYHGDNCTQEVDECQSNSCVNGGECRDLINMYSCSCQPGYTGERCEVNIDDCSTSPCHGESSCIDLINNYTCICGSGLTGEDCNIDIRECDESPCLFDGTCTEPQPGSYSCVCADYSSGTNCEHVISTSFDGLSYLEFSAPAGGYDSLELSVTTSLPDGLILYIENVNIYQALSVELSSNELLMKVQTSVERRQLRMPLKRAIGVISQHQISILISSSYVLVLVPTSSITYRITLESGFRLNLNSSLFIAGLPYRTVFTRSITQSPNLIGCISSLNVNSIAQSLLLAPPTSNHVTLGCNAAVDCNETTCGDHGKCVNKWTSYECSCEQGYSDKRCTMLNSVTLKSAGLLSFPKQTLNKLRFDINSRDTAQGVVFYTLPISTSSAFALDVSESTFNLHIATVGNQQTTVVNSTCNCQSSWCTVELEFQLQSHTIKVICGNAEFSKAGSHSPTQFNSQLMLGALHTDVISTIWRNVLVAQTAFPACIRAVRINDTPLNLADSISSGLSNDPTPHIPGCTIESCQSDYCSEHGQCMESWDGSTCSCEASYEGDNCQYGKPWTFDGESTFLQVTVDQKVLSIGVSGSLKFRTRESRTLMHIRSQIQHLKLSISNNGSLKISHNEHSDIANVKLNTGGWIRLQWNITDMYKLQIRLNDSLIYSVDTTLRWYKDEAVVVSVGAELTASIGGSYSTFNYFKGCISDIYIDTHLITLTSQPEGSTINTNINSLGCHGDDVCEHDVCNDHSVCVDLWNDFICDCLPGWEGSLCLTSIDDCSDKICGDYGTCIDGHLNYTCRCELGYTGQHCDSVISACQSSPCPSDTTLRCLDVFPLNYTCQCKPGYSGFKCTEEINECLSDPCEKGAQCVDQVNGFSCLCNDSYFGEVCQFTKICSSDPCYNGGTCQASADNSLFVCQCADGYNVDVRCQTYNPCYRNDCEHGSICAPNFTFGIYICLCTESYYGYRCESRDYCHDHSCQNGAECQIQDNTYTCICNQHYTGEFCNSVRDKCLDHTCMNNATCYFDSRQPESQYTCRCSDGYSGSLCDVEVNECLSSPCIHGTCIDRLAEYTCTCDRGWTGETCNDDVLECNSNPCLNAGTCVDELNGYRCFCKRGYEGTHCELDYRGCSSTPCYNGATCNPRGELDYICQCMDGFEGVYCEKNINNCRDNLCQSGSSCIDGISSYTCDCLPGYEGTYCTEKLDSCYSNPCNNNGVCTYVGLCNCKDVNQFCGFHDETCQRERCTALADCSVKSSSYTCVCGSTGYTGLTCNEDVDECLTRTHNCINDGRCVNINGSFICDCEVTGYSGSRCQNDVDECQTIRCRNGGTCVNSVGSYFCICLDGWTGNDCSTEILECSSNPCTQNSTCIEGVNGFICNCQPGFTGSLCSDDIDECLSSPCSNGAACNNSPAGSYTCICLSGYTGRFCETEVILKPEASNSPTTTEKLNTTITLNTTTREQSTTSASIVEPQVINQTALVVSLVILFIVCIVAVLAILLYRYNCIPLKNPNTGTYRPDSTTTLPMTMQYDGRDRLI